MARVFSALILDDDPDSIAFIKWYLGEHFPRLRVAAGTEATAAKGFDIYYIDNNFDGQAKAVELVRSLRETESHALVIAYSATLDTKTYKSLLNAGCNGAVEKGCVSDMAVLGRLTKDYIEEQASLEKTEKSHGLRGTVQSMAQLVGQWNRAITTPQVKSENG